MSTLKIEKCKKAQLMTRMVTGEQLPELDTAFWKTKSGLVPVLGNATGFKTVVEGASINEVPIRKKHPPCEMFLWVLDPVTYKVNKLN